MRLALIGIVVGLIVGLVVGTTLVAPQLDLPQGRTGANATQKAEADLPPVLPPADSRTTRLRVASAFAVSMPQLGTLAKRIEKELSRVSGGAIEVKLYDPGAVVPVNALYDAVASGAVDAAFASPAFWGNKVPALELFGAVPFGPSPDEYLAWFYFGGGSALYEQIYARDEIHGLMCGLISPEAAGWFRHEVRTIEDLRGLRMRIDGLGARVLQKLGAKTRALGAGDAFMALETGDLDAVAFSMPAIDIKLGFHEMVKHYYFPGWHQPATFFDLIIKKDRWEGFSPAAQAQIESVCGDNVRHGLAEAEARQFAALKTLTSKNVRIHRWPDTILDPLAKAWREVAEERASASEDFKRVWESLKAFREDYGIWNELGRL